MAFVPGKEIVKVFGTRLPKVQAGSEIIGYGSQTGRKVVTVLRKSRAGSH